MTSEEAIKFLEKQAYNNIEINYWNERYVLYINSKSYTSSESLVNAIEAASIVIGE